MVENIAIIYAIGVVLAAVYFGYAEYSTMNSFDGNGEHWLCLFWPVCVAACLIYAAVEGPFWLGRKLYDLRHAKEDHQP